MLRRRIQYKYRFIVTIYWKYLHVWGKIKTERHILRMIERSLENWAGYILGRNCLLTHFIEGKKEGMRSWRKGRKLLLGAQQRSDTVVSERRHNLAPKRTLFGRLQDSLQRAGGGGVGVDLPNAEKFKHTWINAGGYSLTHSTAPEADSISYPSAV
jgi:hypothetical protein